MNSYVAGFIILILVFSLTLIAGNSQTAGFTFQNGTPINPPASDEEPIRGDEISFGGSEPQRSPQANYDRFNPNGLNTTARNGFTRDIYAGSDNVIRPADSQGFTRDIGSTGTGFETPISPSRPEPSGPKPNTFISEGPDRSRDYVFGEATFKFGGTITPHEELNFETRLLGANLPLELWQWRNTSQDEITYRLDFKGAHNIIFEVRAKTNDGRTDATPATWSFRLVHSEQWGDVKISSIRPGFGGVTGESITLFNNSRQNVNITGWSVADPTSRATIGQAADVLQPRANLNFNSDVILAPNGNAIIHSEVSPIGISYRENACTTHFTSKPFIDGNTEYETCYFENRSDSDFLRDRWVIYLSLTSPLWENRTTFFLFDRAGGVVDVRDFQ